MIAEKNTREMFVLSLLLGRLCEFVIISKILQYLLCLPFWRPAMPAMMAKRRQATDIVQFFPKSFFPVFIRVTFLKRTRLVSVESR